MKLIQLTLILSFSLTLNSCRLKEGSSDIEEEGMFNAANSSVSKLLRNLTEFYKLDESEVRVLSTILPRAIQASFRIEGSLGRALTAVFIDSQGTFISAGHGVFPNDRRVKVKINQVTPNGQIESKEDDFLVEIKAHFFEALDRDIVLGQVLNMKNAAYLDVSEKAPTIGSRVISLGFPGAKSMVRKQDVKFDYDSCYKNALNSSKKYDTQSLWFRYFDTNAKLCEIAKKYRDDGRLYDYVEASNQNLFITLGTIHYVSEYRILTDADTIPGFSGGPSIDLLAGNIVGVHSQNAPVDAGLYGGSAVQPTTKDTLEKYVIEFGAIYPPAAEKAAALYARASKIVPQKDFQYFPCFVQSFLKLDRCIPIVLKGAGSVKSATSQISRSISQACKQSLILEGNAIELVRPIDDGQDKYTVVYCVPENK